MCSMATQDAPRGKSALRALVVTPNNGFERRVAEARDHERVAG
jgi:hypothetical protein